MILCKSNLKDYIVFSEISMYSWEMGLLCQNGSSQFGSLLIGVRPYACHGPKQIKMGLTLKY